MKLFNGFYVGDRTTKTWEFNIPFTGGNKWVEFELYRNKWFDLELKEIYEVTDPAAIAILGRTDSRTFFQIGFRVPLRKEREYDVY